MSLKDVAKKGDLSHSYLSQIENGHRGAPKPDMIKKLSVGLGVSYIELLQKAGYIEEAEKEGLMKSAEEFREYRERNKLEDIADLNERSFIFDDIIYAAYLNTDFIYEGEALERNEKVFIADVLKVILRNDIPVDDNEREKIIKLIETLLK